MNGVTVVDDYGHHPTEIRATLAAARSVLPRAHARAVSAAPLYAHPAPDGRFRARFPRRPTLLVLDIYAASEKPIEGVTSEALVERMRQFGHRGAEYAASNEAGVEAIMRRREAGDMILTLGAGSVSQLGEKILEAPSCLSPLPPLIRRFNPRLLLRVAFWSVLFSRALAFGARRKSMSFLHQRRSRFSLQRAGNPGRGLHEPGSHPADLAPDFRRKRIPDPARGTAPPPAGHRLGSNRGNQRLWPDRLVDNGYRASPVAFAKFRLPEPRGTGSR